MKCALKKAVKISTGTLQTVEGITDHSNNMRHYIRLMTLSLTHTTDQGLALNLFCSMDPLN